MLHYKGLFLRNKRKTKSIQCDKKKYMYAKQFFRVRLDKQHRAVCLSENYALYKKVFCFIRSKQGGTTTKSEYLEVEDIGLPSKVIQFLLLRIIGWVLLHNDKLLVYRYR